MMENPGGRPMGSKPLMLQYYGETTVKTSRRAGAQAAMQTKRSFGKFRRTLLRMRDLACAEMGGLVELIPEASLHTVGTGGAADTAGHCSHAAEFAVAEAEQERLLAYLDSLDDALERIAEGRYGQCIVCGGPISTDRLEGLPCAERCTQCQRKLAKAVIESARI